MDFALSPSLQELSERATKIGHAAALDRQVREDSWLVGNDRAFSQELAKLGWIGMTWPTEFGGGGYSAVERFVVIEALISTGAPVAATWFADRQIGPTLLQFGTDDQRERWLPGIIAGTDMWCIGMSEPDAGSDVSAIRTKAVRDGDDWIVSGQKIWTSGAEDADWMYLVCRTDPDAPPHKGLSEFVVAMDSPGIEVRPIRDMTNNEHFCEVHFDEVRVPHSHLCGRLNESFGQIMRQMEHERGGIDRLVSNKALYEETKARFSQDATSLERSTLERSTLERSDLEQPAEPDPVSDRRTKLLRQRFAKCETMYQICRHMVLREVLGQSTPGWSTVTKTLATEFEIEVAALCGDVLGSHTMLWNRTSRNICYAPGYIIMGGTTQILRNILGERVLGLQREPRPRPA